MRTASFQSPTHRGGLQGERTSETQWERWLLQAGTGNAEGTAGTASPAPTLSAGSIGTICWVNQPADNSLAAPC